MEYLNHLAIIFSIEVILALSYAFIVGYSGSVSLAQTGFAGIGAYTTAVLTTRYDVNFFLTILIGIFIAVICAAGIGAVLSRFRGDFYMLGTVGFSMIAYVAAINWESVTRGPLGISGIPRPEIFGYKFLDNFWFMILALGFVVLVYFGLKFIVESPLGRVLKSIREDETIVNVFGYKASRFKFFAFLVAASVASLAGSLNAAYITYQDASGIVLNAAIFSLSIAILGGLGSLRGTLLGALVLVLLPEVLRFIGFPNEIAGQMRALVFGLLLIILMLYRPQGFMGEFKL